MQTRNISHQVVEAVAGGIACTVEVQSIQRIENISVIRNLKVRNDRFAESFDFNVLAVIFSDRNGRINDIRNQHHPLPDLTFQLGFAYFEVLKLYFEVLDLLLCGFSLVLLALTVQFADFLGNAVTVSAECACAGLCVAELLVECRNFIDQHQFLVLELLLDVLFDEIRIFSNQFNVNHVLPPTYKKPSSLRDDG